MARFTINGTDLRRAIKMTVPYTADDTRPTMQGVAVEPADDDHVRLTGTDGYALLTTLVQASEIADDEYDHIEAYGIIHRDDLKRIDKNLPRRAADLANVTVAFELTRRAGAATIIAPGAAEPIVLTFEPVAGTFVQYHKLIPSLPLTDDDAARPTPVLALDSRLLRLVADAGKLSDSGIVRLLTPASKSSVMVATLTEPETVIAVMPMFVSWDDAGEPIKRAAATVR
jgi:hypothetical protein